MNDEFNKECKYIPIDDVPGVFFYSKEVVIYDPAFKEALMNRQKELDNE